MKKFADYILVGIQIILFILYWWQPKAIADFLPLIWKYSGWALMIAGGISVLLALLQLNKNISMLPTPTTEATLKTSGIFALLRHPIYAGIIYFAVGYAFLKQDFMKMLMAILITVFFEIKVVYEEKKLKQKFPEYDTYKNKTGKFFPAFLLKSKKDGTQNPE